MNPDNLKRMHAKEALLTAEEAHELLIYDLKSGEFHWKVTYGKVKAGKRAGTRDPHGYRRIQIKGRLYREHRLAHLMVLGTWPTDEIDHRDPTAPRDDNRWSQIRPASRSQNNANQRIRHANTSGFKGVCWHHHTQKWRVQISIDNYRRHIGLFTDITDAAAAYARAAHHYFGDFAYAEDLRDV